MLYPAVEPYRRPGLPSCHLKTRFEHLVFEVMRRFLTLAALFVLVSEPAWAQGFFQHGAPYSGQYYRLPTYPYFTPPRGPRRAAPTPANVKIPQPEKATIGEQYAKGSIVIVNHERNLYFVEEPGQAIRYPVAIGSPVEPMGRRANRHGKARKSHLVST